MQPKRVACKFFVHPDPSAAVELHPFIGLFHRFIQQGTLPGLLIDVADYAHVPEGPGVLLVGHDVDYGLDLNAGRAGLLTVRKRLEGADLAGSLRSALEWGLRAVDAIERDGGTGVRFDPHAVTLLVLDRLAAPNQDDAFARLVELASPVLSDLYGDEKLELSRAGDGDPRGPLGLHAIAQETAGAVELADRLVAGGAR